MHDRPGILPELVIPIGGLLFSLYYVSTVQDLPFQARVVGVYISVALFALALLLFIRFVRDVIAGRRSLGVQGFLSRTDVEMKRWLVFGSALLLVVLMPIFGFVLSLFLFVATTAFIIGGVARLPMAVLTATVLTSIAFGVFIVLVEVRFPLSEIDRTLLAWVR